VEWIGLILLVALLFAAVVAGGVRLPGLAIAETLASKLVCFAGLDAGDCLSSAVDTPLVAAYGNELAAEVASNAPRIEYEAGMRAVPVDFRDCRADPCSLGPESGEVDRTDAGEPVTLFVHTIDCRAPVPRDGLNCSGDRAGHVYVQYWAYYPGSQSLKGFPGNPGFHNDDWESFQMKLGNGDALARASSHHGYNYTAGAASWLSDAGFTHRPAWGESEGRYYVSGGSHAGHAHEIRPGGAATVPAGRAAATVPVAQLRRAVREGERFTPGSAIHLVPIEPIAEHGNRWRFAISPPWRKRVYRDPEYEGTD
jgi:hypothetical protein